MAFAKKKVALLNASHWFGTLGQRGKEEVMTLARQVLANQGLMVVDEDSTRPWGGYLVVDPRQAVKFLRTFFGRKDDSSFRKSGPLSLKLMLIAPEQKLSWQYHRRRTELVRIIAGKLTLFLSGNDQQPSTGRPLTEGSELKIPPLLRHRMETGENWGIYAEIWEHSDTTNPSDESDIVRLTDVYKRLR